MSLKTYIGARYTPKYIGEWNKQTEYGPLSVVSVNEDANYVSKKVVPVNTEITNTEYWLKVASWNAQVEQYNQNVNNYRHSIEEYRLAVESFYADTIHAFDNKAAMIADTSLKDGETAMTCGDETLGDGKGQFYQITSTADSTTVQLANSLYAKPFTFFVYEDTTKCDNITTSFYYYISKDGSDDNDGLTAEHPIQSFAPILKKIEQGQTDVRVAFLDNGIYTVDGNSFHNLVFHANSDASETGNATINFTIADKSVAWYNSHLNLNKVNLQTNNEPYRIYFDHCLLHFENCTINSNEFGITDCYVNLVNITTNRLKMNSVSGLINGLHITNQTDNYAIHAITCNALRLYGNFTVDDLPSTITSTHAIVNITFSTGFMYMFTHSLSTTYAKGLDATNVLMWITDNRYNGLNKIGSGNNLVNVVRVTQNFITPNQG